MTEALGLSPIEVGTVVLVLQVVTAVALPVVAATLTLARHASDAID